MQRAACGLQKPRGALQSPSGRTCLEPQGLQVAAAFVLSKAPSEEGTEACNEWSTLVTSQ